MGRPTIALFYVDRRGANVSTMRQAHPIQSGLGEIKELPELFSVDGSSGKVCSLGAVFGP